MKIVMIAPTPFFADRGCHTRIYEEIKSLQSLGHQIILCTYGLGRDMPGIKTVRCFNFSWYKKLSAGPSYTKIFLLPFLTYTTIKTIIKFKPEIVHPFLHEGALVARFCKLFFPKKKYFFDMQGSMVGECLEHKFFRSGGFFYKLAVWLEKKISSWFFIITQSEYLTNYLISLGVSKDRIANVKDGVDINFFKPFAFDNGLAKKIGIDENKIRIIYIGLLESYQGADLMFKAFFSVARQKPGIQFIIVGYPNIEKYIKICEELGIADKVKFLGKIDYSILPNYLSLATIAIAPKISLAEGDGKIYNYMASGLATVAFDRSVSREILGPTGVFAKFGDANDLALKILWAINHKEEVRLIGKAARDRAEAELSWRAVGLRINQVYLR